jgi:hypothetical protein
MFFPNAREFLPDVMGSTLHHSNRYFIVLCIMFIKIQIRPVNKAKSLEVKNLVYHPIRIFKTTYVWTKKLYHRAPASSGNFFGISMRRVNIRS